MLCKTNKKKVTSPKEVADIFRAILATECEVDQGKEHFWVCGVDTKKMIQYIELVSLGTLDATLIHPREVFRYAVMKGVADIILAHNHPSGDCEPSGHDHTATRRLSEAGTILGITVVDHVIVGDGYYSFSESGNLRG